MVTDKIRQYLERNNEINIEVFDSLLAQEIKTEETPTEPTDPTPEPGTDENQSETPEQQSSNSIAKALKK